MTFHIYRASYLPSDKKPCEEAEEILIGSKSGLAVRVYRLEINSLDELMDFINKYGDIVIYKGSSSESPKIVIYDDYLE